jgi:hypothetical protein
MANDRNALKQFQNLAGSLKNRRASRGDGSLGNWPADGDHTVLIRSIDFKAGKFTLDFKSNPPRTIPCLVVRFNYEVVADSSRPDYNPDEPVVQFGGRPMELINPETTKFPPPKAGSEKNFVQIRAEQDLERFMGFAAGILNITEEEAQQSDPTELLTRLDEKLVDGNTITATVRLSTRNYDKKDASGKVTGIGEDKKDFFRELLTA